VSEAERFSADLQHRSYGYDSGLTIPGTNLIHYGARYYNPAEDQWTQQDPSRQDPDYIYAADDPVNVSDTTGSDDTELGNGLGAGGLTVGGSEVASAGAEGLAAVGEVAAGEEGLSAGALAVGVISTAGLIVVEPA
jgi:RHS repeat-associated protein